jgi:ABC-type glutathione transport system ATPase component
MTALAILDLLPASAERKSGQVLFKDKDIFKLDPERKRSLRGKDIAMVFQEPFTALNPVMRIGEQISETILAHENPSKAETAGRVKELLDIVRLSPGITSMYPHELSGGMRQRAMLAMALCCDPEILILDEPTTALDVSIQKHILDLIKSIQRERKLTTLFITHDFSVVNTVADRVCVMNQGFIVECGEKNKVLKEPGHEYTRKLIDCIPRLGDKRERLPA